MWCAHCTQEVTNENDHALCKDAVWRAMSNEFTSVKLAFQKQCDPGVPKGETVEVRNDDTV